MALKVLVHGSRSIAVSAASAYLDAAGGNEYGSTYGTPIMRNGSIVGLTCCATVSGFAVSGTLTIEVRVNDVSVFSATSPTITGNSTVSWQATQDEGIDLLSSTLPDVVQLRIIRDSGTFNYLPIATCKLILEEDNESFRDLIVASSSTSYGFSAVPVNLLTAGGAPLEATRAIRMLEGGSIVGIGLHGSCSFFSANSVTRAQVRVNSVVVFETDDTPVTALGPYTRTFKTQATDIDTFAAGDLIQVTLVPTLSAVIINNIVVVELQFPVPVVPPSTIEIGAGDIGSIEIGAGAIATTEQGGGAVAPTELGSGVIGSTELAGGPSGAIELGA